jgi:hypothetical protein
MEVGVAVLQAARLSARAAVVATAAAFTIEIVSVGFMACSWPLRAVKLAPAAG